MLNYRLMTYLKQELHIEGNMITLQPTAVAKLKELFAEENNPNLKLRVFVQGGGCSGFSYGFTFDEEVNADVDTLNGSSFSIKNPQATTTCGCGSSFAV
jgi:iron-sulfur cluster insertion protein